VALGFPHHHKVRSSLLFLFLDAAREHGLGAPSCDIAQRKTRLNSLPLFTKPPDLGEKHRFTTRIVTVCVKDIHNDFASNKKRIALLNRFIDALAKQSKANAQWREIDAVLLPAGFFSLPHPIGHKSDLMRMRRIESSHTGQALKAASLSLNQRLYTPTSSRYNSSSVYLEHSPRAICSRDSSSEVMNSSPSFFRRHDKFLISRDWHDDCLAFFEYYC
jgi:hypothetical protein